MPISLVNMKQKLLNYPASPKPYKYDKKGNSSAPFTIPRKVSLNLWLHVIPLHNHLVLHLTIMPQGILTPIIWVHTSFSHIASLTYTARRKYPAVSLVWLVVRLSPSKIICNIS